MVAKGDLTIWERENIYDQFDRYVSAQQQGYDQDLALPTGGRGTA